MKYLKSLYKKSKPYLPKVGVFLAIITLSISSVAYAQFARQTGSIGWGYGYGYGYGYGHGWDRAADAGRRIVRQPEWTFYTSENSELASDRISFVTADPNSTNVWLVPRSQTTGIPTGLQKFDGSTWTYQTTGNSDIPIDEIDYLAIDINSDLWLTGENASSSNAGLIHYDVSEDAWTQYTEENSDIPSNDVSGTVNIFSIDTDSQGNVWFLSRGAVIKFDPQEETFTTYDGSYLGDSPRLTSLTIDADDNVWVGTVSVVELTTFTNTLARFDGTDWTSYTSSNSNMAPYTPIPVSSDSEGVWLWYTNLESEDGVGIGYFDGESTWNYYSASNSGLEFDYAFGAYPDQYDQAWVTAVTSEEPFQKSFQLFDKEAGVWTNIDIPEETTAPITFGGTSDGKMWGWSILDGTDGIFSVERGVAEREFAYGYGYGFLDERGSDSESISWNSDESRYEVNSEGALTLSRAGVVIPIGSDEIATASALEYLFKVRIALGDDVVTIPAETQFAIGAEVNEETDYVFNQDADEDDLALLSDEGEVLAHAVFGINNIPLTSDKSVTIALNAGSSNDGKILTVYHKSPLASSWEELTTCEVGVGDAGSGYCEFTATSFSSFAAIDDGSSSQSSSASGGPGGGFPEEVTFQTTYENTSSSQEPKSCSSTECTTPEQVEDLPETAEQQNIWWNTPEQTQDTPQNIFDNIILQPEDLPNTTPEQTQEVVSPEEDTSNSCGKWCWFWIGFGGAFTFWTLVFLALVRDEE